MTELRFDKHYTHRDAKTFVKLEFEVPEGAERIEVEYDYPRFAEEILPEGGRRVREINIFDLGLYDQNGDLTGWSGSERKQIFVASHAASPGYRKGKPAPGKWAVALGIYRVEKTADLGVRIRIFPAERTALLGDLHAHTQNSDGVYTAGEIFRFSQDTGLDFIAVTDHNTLGHNHCPQAQSENAGNLTVIPGMEFTSYRGHANFFFPEAAPFCDNFLCNNFEEMAGLFERAKKSGASISLNHPFSDCPWEFGYEGFPFDMIEVWSSASANADSRKAIERWHRLLCEGKKIAAAGGSDTHRIVPDRFVGLPCTYAYSMGRSVRDILHAIATGHSGIAFCPSGPLLDFDIGGAGPGDTVSFAAHTTGRLMTRNTRAGDHLQLITEKGVVWEFTVSFDGDAVFPFQPEAALFYRGELFRTMQEKTFLAGMSNPVYNLDAR